uniref:Uncharacterized protein n=1 Tax=Myotis myotis TaxID=51298 RepID=A0A7J7RUQ2_MYOMY|nr:hypothetical protein mMyoMyo1_010160 [Myotis myotis]
MEALSLPITKSPPPCLAQSLPTSSHQTHHVVDKAHVCLACLTLPDPACSLSWGLGGGNGRSPGKNFADSHCSSSVSRVKDLLVVACLRVSSRNSVFIKCFQSYSCLWGANLLNALHGHVLYEF